MTNKNFIKVVRIAGVAVVASLCLCAKAPQQDIDATKAAFEDAKVFSADKYAAEQFQQAQAKYDAAMAEIASQNSKSPLMRNYTLSSQLLKEALESAAAAKQQAEQNKTAMKTEAETTVEQAKKSSEEVTTALADAKKKNKAVETLEPESAALPQLIQQATTSLANGDYYEAREIAKSVATKAAAIKTGIDSLAAAPAPKAKKK